MNDKIIVLLSSYNGEKYIKEQIESILHQEKVSPYIIVRDDGSEDATIEVLKEYKRMGKLDYIQGKT